MLYEVITAWTPLRAEPLQTGRQGIFLRLLFALMILIPCVALGRPPLPPAEMRAEPWKAGWSVDERTGCWIWNANPRDGETVHWSEGCGPDGPANGSGVVEFRVGESVARYEGDP